MDFDSILTWLTCVYTAALLSVPMVDSVVFSGTQPSSYSKVTKLK